MTQPSSDHNPYQAPSAPVMDAPAQDLAQFYVVGRAKFLVMMIGTLGLYGYYWFYKNWALFNRRHGRGYWPVPRAIFSVFFTHSLFAEVDHAIRSRGATFRWSHAGVATVYVVSAIVSYVLGRLSGKEIGSPYTDLGSIALMVPMVWSLYVGQRAINTAEADVDGSSNAKLTVANILWLIPFALIWLLLLLGLAVIFLDVPTE